MANVLFICTSNSVRSQIAEGWARHLGDETIGVRSAGLQPFMVHPLAIQTMREAGVDISRQSCRRLNERLLTWADHIVTLCETAKPSSDLYPNTAVHHHWPIPNPDDLTPTGLTPEQAYAQIRDDIRARVEELLRNVRK